MALETTDATFKQNVLDSELPVLVDFWAPWCGPCRAVGPVIEALSKKVEGKANVYKCNVDENPQVSQQYEIHSIPTVKVFKNGEVIHTLVGARSEGDYLKALGL